jgi:O-acetyl-ADP-ribose deacetylase (regulator of RNase III)
MHTLAFPAMSSGRYGFPIETAVEIALGETVEQLRRNDSVHVTCVCFDPAVYAEYLSATR